MAGDGYYGALGLPGTVCVIPGGLVGVDGLPHFSQPCDDTMVAVDLGEGRTALAVKAGKYHNCALLDNNRVKCWGSNDKGQLGLGDSAYRVGSDDGEMGDDLPYVDLGSVEGVPLTATAIAVSKKTSCALLLNKRVKCWGRTPLGRIVPEEDIVKYQWTSIGRYAGFMGDELPYVDLGDDPVADIECAEDTCCAVFENGRSKCWGKNDGGLGAVDPSSNDDEPMRNTFQWAVSRVPFTELGPGSEVTQILPHERGGCALLSDGRVKCWGQCPFSPVLHRRLSKRAHAPRLQGKENGTATYPDGSARR